MKVFVQKCTCKYCKKYFKYETSRKKHEKTCPKNPDFLGFKCDLCDLKGIGGYHYSNKDSLRVHYRDAHTSKPKPRCKYCKRKFSSNQYRNTHQKKCPGN